MARKRAAKVGVKKSTKSCKKGRRVGLNKWTEAAMASAIAHYNEQKAGGMASIRTIAKAYGVPKSTFERRVNGKVAGSKHASGRKPYFSIEEKSELSQMLLTMARRGFPLRENEVRNLATEYAVKNGMTSFCSNKSQQAGYFWFRGFLARHPELKVKRAEGLSAARAQAVNKEKVNHWFAELKAVLDKNNVIDSPTHLWNVDESGLQDVFQSKRAVGETGKQLYQVQSGEKGDTTTVIPVFNAVGTIATLMVIFKGARLRPDHCIGSPQNTVIRCSKDGWVNKELFLELGVNFVKFIKSLSTSDNRKHVLLMDGHGSHLYNLEFLKLMTENNVEVFCFPPHTSHILQPADVSLFKSLKSHWTSEGLKFTKDTAGQKVGKQHFFRIFTPAWEKSATVVNIQAGFRSTGIFPFNPQAVKETAFLPSLTTDNRNEEAAVQSGSVEPPKEVSSNVSSNEQPSCSTARPMVNSAADSEPMLQPPAIINYIQVTTLDIEQLQEFLGQNGQYAVITNKPPDDLLRPNDDDNFSNISLSVLDEALPSLDASFSDILQPVAEPMTSMPTETIQQLFSQQQREEQETARDSDAGPMAVNSESQVNYQQHDTVSMMLGLLLSSYLHT